MYLGYLVFINGLCQGLRLTLEGSPALGWVQSCVALLFASRQEPHACLVLVGVDSKSLKGVLLLHSYTVEMQLY